MSSISYSEMETRIQHAIEMINSQEISSISAVARELELPEQRLRARLKGHQSRQSRLPTNKKLCEDQELGLCRYLDKLDTIGIPPRYHLISKYANAILARSEPDADSQTPSSTVSKMWTSRFLERHPEYHIRKQKSLDVDRKQAHNSEDLYDWFLRYQEIVEKKGILAVDSYNFDETGFRIGIGRDQWVVTREPTRPMYVASSSRRELVTVIETISGNGAVLPPAIIIPGVLHMEDWYMETDLPDDFLVGVSETGYSNDMRAMDWLHHFEHFSSKQQVGAWRLLLLDGHDSHCTREFIEFCDDHKIVLFCFPPHCTHLLQPLDVVVFQPYKHYHAEAVDAATRTGCSEFNKVEFLSAMNSIRSATFKPTTILSAFKKTGLIPFEPEMVIQKLVEHEISETPHTPPQQLENYPTTPQSIRSLKRHADKLQMELSFLSPTKQRALESFVKGSLIQAQSGAQAFEDLENTKAAELARATRQKRSRRLLQNGGVMYAHQARAMVRQKEKDSIEKQLTQAQRSLAVVEKAAEKKTIKQWKDISRNMKTAVREMKKKQKHQKLLFHSIGRSIVKISTPC